MSEALPPPEAEQFLAAAGNPAATSAPPSGLDDAIAEMREERYGGTGQQAITALEGAASAATFGLSTGAERALGVDPADIQGRRDTNPGAHMLGQVGGLAASTMIPGVGAAELLGSAGKAAAGALGLGAKGATMISRVGADAVKGAFESALFQGGDEISKAFAQDPHQTAESALTEMGLATVLGGALSGAAGAALRKAGFIKDAVEVAPGMIVSELDRPALEAGEFRAAINHNPVLGDAEKQGILAGLAEQKPNAAEIKKAAADIGAPVMEGMTSASKAVQRAEDSLLNGAPTISGLKRQQLYSEGHRIATGVVDQALGEGSNLSKAEIGNQLKSSLSRDIQAESQPISEMYDEIKKYHEAIPLSERSAPAIARNIAKDADIGRFLKLSGNSPEAKFLSNVMEEVGNLKTVDDVKWYKTQLRGRVAPTASSNEKRIAAIISDKLTNLEESSIERFAKTQMKTPDAKAKILGLIDQRAEANTRYKGFITKVQELSEQLGKGRVYGTQDALHFIGDLTPEQVTQRLFAKNNSEFMSFFENNFPEQMAQMRTYQRGILREAASQSGELNPKHLFKAINKMEPELQRTLFDPLERQRLRAAETYLKSFPERFNPSGTHGAADFARSFESPARAAFANVRDYGIEKFIRAVGSSPEEQSASRMGRATVAGWRSITSAADALFQAKALPTLAAVTPSIASRDQLKQLVASYSADPSPLFDMGENNPVPEYNQAFAETSMRAVQYLASLEPKSQKTGILDAEPKVSRSDEAKYERALDLAQSPALIFHHIQNGTLPPQDVQTVRTIYPGLHKHMESQIMRSMIDHVSKGHKVPYRTRMGLSLFLGQPLDSTMTPQALMAARSTHEQPAPEAQGAPRAGHSMKGLDKVAGQYATPGQSREMSNARRS